MAAAEMKVEVSLEASLHKVLADVLNDIEREHGVRIDSIHVDWLDITGVGDPRPVGVIKTLSMKTTTGHL